MSLAAGGHLTHGAAPNQSGKWFNAVQYGVRRDDHRIDFDEVEALAKEHQPKLSLRAVRPIRASSILPVSAKLLTVLVLFAG